MVEIFMLRREAANNPIDEDEELKLLQDVSRNDSAGDKKRRRENKWNGLAANFVKSQQPQVELEQDVYAGMKWDRDFIEKLPDNYETISFVFPAFPLFKEIIVLKVYGGFQGQPGDYWANLGSI